MDADVLPASPALAPISIRVDEAAQTVTARFAGFFARQARRVADRGCVLDLEPAQPPPAVQMADPGRPALPWPQGDAALLPDQWGPGVDAIAMQKLARDAFIGAGDAQTPAQWPSFTRAAC